MQVVGERHPTVGWRAPRRCDATRSARLDLSRHRRRASSSSYWLLPAPFIGVFTEERETPFTEEMVASWATGSPAAASASIVIRGSSNGVLDRFTRIVRSTPNPGNFGDEVWGDGMIVVKAAVELQSGRNQPSAQEAV